MQIEKQWDLRSAQERSKNGSRPRLPRAMSSQAALSLEAAFIRAARPAARPNAGRKPTIGWHAAADASSNRGHDRWCCCCCDESVEITDDLAVSS